MILASALGFGAMHAFEPDHMAAVSTFVARRPTPREAAGFGIKWALGHGLSLLIIGSVLFALKMAVSQPVLFSSGVLDRIVGGVLMLLGIWTLLQLRPGSVHHEHRFQRVQPAEPKDIEEAPLFGAPGSAPSAAPPTYVNAQAKHGSLLMGMLHGAAGTGAFVSQAALALSNRSYPMVFAYTLVFSIGVLLAMGFYAGLLGGALTWGGRRGAKLLQAARGATGVLACAIGVCLILGVELPGVFSFLEH